MSTTFDPRSHGGALVVVAELGTIEVTGSDRKSWLNGLVTCDLAPLQPGQGAYGLSVSKVGRIQADTLVAVGNERILVGCPLQRAQPLSDALEAYLVMEDAEQRVVSDAYGWLLLHGPDASRLAKEASDAGLGQSAQIDLTGLGGAALVTPRSGLEGALTFLVERGATRGDEQAWERLRIERGVPRFSVDFDEKTYPQEASLERRAVSFNKGCYLGQEVVCRLEMRGHVHRKLVSLVFDGGEADVPAPKADVSTPAGEAIGAITSATFSPSLGKPIALAMVKYAQSAEGTELRIGERVAHVVSAPAAQGPSS